MRSQSITACRAPLARCATRSATAKPARHESQSWPREPTSAKLGLERGIGLNSSERRKLPALPGAKLSRYLVVGDVAARAVRDGDLRPRRPAHRPARLCRPDRQPRPRRPGGGAARRAPADPDPRANAALRRARRNPGRARPPRRGPRAARPRSERILAAPARLPGLVFALAATALSLYLSVFLFAGLPARGPRSHARADPRSARPLAARRHDLGSERLAHRGTQGRRDRGEPRGRARLHAESRRDDLLEAGRSCDDAAGLGGSAGSAEPPVRPRQIVLEDGLILFNAEDRARCSASNGSRRRFRSQSPRRTCPSTWSRRSRSDVDRHRARPGRTTSAGAGSAGEAHRRIALGAAALPFGLLALGLALGRRNLSRSTGTLMGIAGAVAYYALVQLVGGAAAQSVDAGRALDLASEPRVGGRRGGPDRAGRPTRFRERSQLGQGGPHAARAIRRRARRDPCQALCAPPLCREPVPGHGRGLRGGSRHRLSHHRRLRQPQMVQSLWRDGGRDRALLRREASGARSPRHPDGALDLGGPDDQPARCQRGAARYARLWHPDPPDPGAR